MIDDFACLSFALKTVSKNLGQSVVQKRRILLTRSIFLSAAVISVLFDMLPSLYYRFTRWLKAKIKKTLVCSSP